MKIAVPDFAVIAKKYIEKDKDFRIGWLVGGQTDEYDFHKCIFDESLLRDILEKAGLTDIIHWQSDFNDCSNFPISLNLQGRKPLGTTHDIHEEKRIDVHAVISMPRLAFTENMFCAMQAVLPMNIEITRGTGVFWGQVLTRLIEDTLKKKPDLDYILTLDYDTWFKRAHVIRLLQLMVENPQADAITSVQMKREDDYPLFGRRGEDGEVITVAPAYDFAQPLTPVNTAHFGLTVFKASVFKNLKRPWFLAVPGDGDSWNENRQDEDIYFWNNFINCGYKIYLANEVNIGHLQMMCTFPGKPDDNWKPVHCYMKDIEDGKVPEWCIPKVEMKK